MSRLTRILAAFKRWLGFDVCATDGRVHDYHVKNGGDGMPTHFYAYTCWKCGKEFGI